MLQFSIMHRKVHHGDLRGHEEQVLVDKVALADHLKEVAEGEIRTEVLEEEDGLEVVMDLTSLILEMERIVHHREVLGVIENETETEIEVDDGSGDICCMYRGGRRVSNSTVVAVILSVFVIPHTRNRSSSPI
jgi:hypothetical protein